MKLAIMQPYFFPYIGYFQLVGAVDYFMFYDDVNFIKRGWINRTNILSNNGRKLITVNLSQSTQNKPINEILLAEKQDKLLMSVFHNYKKAPFFSQVFPLVEACLKAPYNKISEFAANTIIETAKYMGLETEFGFSSEFHGSTVDYEKERRLIDICRKENAEVYINSIGGKAIYSKETFGEAGIQLYFLKSKEDINYNQMPVLKEGFESNLSIIDVLMFNAPEETAHFLQDYELY